MQQGALPCDAPLLRARAQAFIQLGKGVQRANLRQLLNEHPSVLRFEPAQLRQGVQALLALLPQYDGTTMLRAALPELQLQPQLLALQYMELQELFAFAFDANLPPAVFSYLARAAAGGGGGGGEVSSRTGAGAPAASAASAPSAAAAPAAAAAAAAEEQQQDEELAGAAAPRDVASIQARLAALVQGFGREVAYVALGATPQLLALPPQALRRRHAELAALLRLDGVRALYLLQQHGALLLLPLAAARARHAALGPAIGWPQEEGARLARHDPGLLLQESGVLAAKWARLRQLGAARRQWARELGAGGLAFASDVLRAGEEEYDRLEYLSAAGLRQGARLRQVLGESAEEFGVACPRFRRWRVLRAEGRGRLGGPGYSGLVRVEFE